MKHERANTMKNHYYDFDPKKYFNGNDRYQDTCHFNLCKLTRCDVIFAMYIYKHDEFPEISKLYVIKMAHIFLN